MKHKFLFLLLIFLTLFSCKEPEARRPKKHSTTNFYKELIEKNKQLIRQETQEIERFISKDSVHVYQASASGFWYYYNHKIEGNLAKPTSEETVEITYNITDLEGKEIYPKQNKTHKIDKEDFIPALQNGIKLMKVGETITFVIPSHRAFGVAGDGEKIGVNKIIKSTVTLINIKNEN